MRAARMCVLFARINLSALPDIGPEVTALIHSTSLLLESAARYLDEASASRVTLSTRFPELRATIVEIDEQLAGVDPYDTTMLKDLEQQLGALFTALAAEEVS